MMGQLHYQTRIINDLTHICVFHFIISNIFWQNCLKEETSCSQTLLGKIFILPNITLESKGALTSLNIYFYFLKELLITEHHFRVQSGLNFLYDK